MMSPQGVGTRPLELQPGRAVTGHKASAEGGGKSKLQDGPSPGPAGVKSRRQGWGSGERSSHVGALPSRRPGLRTKDPLPA